MNKVNLVHYFFCPYYLLNEIKTTGNIFSRDPHEK